MRATSVALYPFQELGARWLATQRWAALCDDMGLGKSAQTVAAADLQRLRRLLVVCPAIARDHWAREFLTFQTLARSAQIVRSAADARHLYGDVLIVSYALASKALNALRSRSWDLLILDEAQALKTPESTRTRAIYGRDGLARHAARVWLLSGALAPNHPGELWTHYKVLFGGQEQSPSNNPTDLTKEGVEMARDGLRKVAVERGVVWVREVLDRFGAGRLSELSESQVWETLRAVAA